LNETPAREWRSRARFNETDGWTASQPIWPPAGQRGEGGPDLVRRDKDLSCDETPVSAVATDDGFVIVLVYGLHTDWLKNVLASGSATIVNEGHTFRVDQPEVIPMEAAQGYLSANDQRNLRLIGANQCLRLRRVEPGGAA